MLAYEAIADAFYDEGVRTAFSLTGDGNMHWEATLARKPGMRSIHVRHEHNAVAMATAFAAVTGEPGVASVTCGPGLTQIMTALATAVQAQMPLVVLAGEDPIDATWYNQRIDQAPLVTGTGSFYVAARSLKQIRHSVQEAFVLARTHRLPVVLGIPLDLQQQTAPQGTYVPSRDVLPTSRPHQPHPQEIADAAERIARAERPIILCGRGALAGETRQVAIRLAEICDGALASTLPARGMFSGNPRDIGVAGGFAHEATREAFKACDLVVAVGTSLTRHTSDLNTLFEPDQVIQIDPRPRMRQGQFPATSHVKADGAEALTALCEELEKGATPRAGTWSVPDIARRVAQDPADSTPYPAEIGRLDPRDVAAALEAYVPTRYAQVNSAGHCSYFATHIRGRAAEDFLTIREFGAIGNGLAYAAGRWATRPEQPVMLIEGDGGFLMHVQELETIVRSRMKILIVIFNDGAYGSEIHKLRADGLDESGATFGFGDLAAVARGFGLSGHTIEDLDVIPDLVRSFEADGRSALWDIRISDRVMAPTMRRTTRRPN